MKRLFSFFVINIITLLPFSSALAVESPDSNQYCLLVIVNPKNNSTFEIYVLQENISEIVDKFDIVSINCPQPSSSNEQTVPEGYLF